jgi:hypothetical protein
MTAPRGPSQGEAVGRNRVCATLAALAVAAMLGGCRSESSASPLPTANCESIQDRTLVGSAWAAGGSRLMLRSRAKDSQTELEVLNWPSRTVAAVVETGEFESRTSAIDDAGGVYWLRSHTAAAGDSADLVRAGLDGSPVVLGHYVGSFLEVHWGGRPLAVEVGNQGARVVALPTDPVGAPIEVVGWASNASGFWVSRDGESLAWLEQQDPGSPTVLVTQVGQARRHYALPGLGGSQPSLFLDSDVAIYRRTETGRLTMLNLEDGSLRGEVDQGIFAGGEVSDSGIVAALTQRGFHEPNELCSIDVKAALASSPSDNPSRPAVPPADDARKARLLAWLPAPSRVTAIDLRQGLGNDWDTIAYLPRSYDNVAATAALGAPIFDIEAVTPSVKEGEIVVVLIRHFKFVAWFTLSADEFDVTPGGGSFGADEGACIVGSPPRFVGLPGITC